VSPGFRVEPHVRYSTEDTESVEAIPGVPTATAGDTETLEIGAGVFGLSQLKESIRLYYGARASYLDVKRTFTFHVGPDTFRDSEVSNGYRVAPTFGFEYLFNAHFTLGGEAAYFYQRLDDSDNFGSGHSDLESERTGTESFLILRYFF
jgi:hypothetical protein